MADDDTIKQDVEEVIKTEADILRGTYIIPDGDGGRGITVKADSLKSVEKKPTVKRATKKASAKKSSSSDNKETT